MRQARGEDAAVTEAHTAARARYSRDSDLLHDHVLQRGEGLARRPPERGQLVAWHRQVAKRLAQRQGGWQRAAQRVVREVEVPDKTVGQSACASTWVPVGAAAITSYDTTQPARTAGANRTRKADQHQQHDSGKAADSSASYPMSVRLPMDGGSVPTRLLCGRCSLLTLLPAQPTPNLPVVGSHTHTKFAFVLAPPPLPTPLPPHTERMDSIHRIC